LSFPAPLEAEEKVKLAGRMLEPAIKAHDRTPKPKQHPCSMPHTCCAHQSDVGLLPIVKVLFTVLTARLKPPIMQLV